MASYEQGNGDGGAGRKSDDDRKIFVGGLSWETKEQDFREYFSKFGEVTDCTLKMDPTTHKSRGFGFITFASAADVDKVIEVQTHTLHGRNIDPKRAKARPGREPMKKVFVGGLDPELPEEEVRNYFGRFGKIEDVSLPYDKIKNCRRAFAFITFEAEAQADECCREAKHRIGDKEVDVKKAVNKPQDGFGYDPRGRGRGAWVGRGGYGRGRGGYNDWGQGYDYSGYQGYGGGYDGYGSQYGNYDYDYYNQGGWGSNQGYDYGGYGGYGGGNSGYDYSAQTSTGYKGNASYHPYNK